MRPPRFAEAILQNVVRSFKEKNGDLETRSSERIELFFKVREKAAFANVDDERGTCDSFFFIVRDDASKGWQHRYREIVDAEITEILKCVGGGRHSRAAQAGDDYDVGRHPIKRLTTKAQRHKVHFSVLCAFVVKDA